MRKLEILGLILAASTVLAAACSADIPPPDRGKRALRAEQKQKPDPGQVTLQIMPVSEGEQVRLVIPREFLKQVQAGTTHGSGSGAERFRTVIAGLALSLGLALGGLWLFRRQRQPGARTAIAAALLCTAAGAGFLATAARANMAPSFVDTRPILGDVVLPARIVLAESGGTVQLYIPPSRLSGLGARPGGAGTPGSQPSTPGAQPTAAPAGAPPSDTPPTSR